MFSLAAADLTVRACAGVPDDRRAAVAAQSDFYQSGIALALASGCGRIGGWPTRWLAVYLTRLAARRDKALPAGEVGACERQRRGRRLGPGARWRE